MNMLGCSPVFPWLMVPYLKVKGRFAAFFNINRVSLDVVWIRSGPVQVVVTENLLVTKIDQQVPMDDLQALV